MAWAAAWLATDRDGHQGFRNGTVSKATPGIHRPLTLASCKPINKAISQPDVEPDRASWSSTNTLHGLGPETGPYPSDSWLLGTNRDQCRTVILGFLVFLVT